MYIFERQTPFLIHLKSNFLGKQIFEHSDSNILSQKKYLKMIQIDALILFFLANLSDLKMTTIFFSKIR